MNSFLPYAPSIEHLRKQAKDLLRAYRDGEATATTRVEATRPRPAHPLKLADAQLVIAREYGFASWPRLKAYVERAVAHGPDLQHAFRDDIDYYRGRASGLFASALDGTPTALAQFARWKQPVTEAGARTAVAREHGMASWAAFRRHVSSLREGPEPFVRAYRAVEAHDIEGLRQELDRWPDLVSARGTNGNDLLGMASATCNEQLVSLLLERGADPARPNVHGWTPLHQAAQVGMIPLARMLLEAGAPADVSARGDGGTPLIAALFWGKKDMADLLAQHGVFPRNLRTAAGLERIDLIEDLISEGGRVSHEAGDHRGFYRPHSGFPAWQPSSDPQEVLDEALCWASRNDRVESITLLVARGARIDADVYRGTPLAWAAFCECVGAVGRLLRLGADPNCRATFGGPHHGDNVTAMHLAAQNGHVDVIRALLDAGADPTLRDALYDSTPAGWAEHEGQPAALEVLRERGG